ncbi:hypothetical protein ACO0M4_38745 [Streptomyces sp. RGM 3693]|uniref:hypothetical protein n=1 Tax=Streptomyces sp. RGM 3693 TaxID=3413284 RepID=UPI003D29B791
MIALLAISRVVEGAVFRPLVEVPMLMTGAWVSEDENVRRLRALADTTLPATAIPVVKLLAQDGIARLQRPLGFVPSLGQHEGIIECLPLGVVESVRVPRKERA